jgi:hypothetical protein
MKKVNMFLFFLSRRVTPGGVYRTKPTLSDSSERENKLDFGNFIVIFQ